MMQISEVHPITVIGCAAHLVLGPDAAVRFVLPNMQVSHTLHLIQGGVSSQAIISLMIA
jgi:hypothetical protein